MNYHVGMPVTVTKLAHENEDLTVGKTYAVVELDTLDEKMPIRVIDDTGEPWWLHVDNFTVVSDELIKLRAFKAQAIARFPSLAKPETDEEAAARFCREAGLYDEGDSWQVALNAITWARANPR